MTQRGGHEPRPSRVDAAPAAEFASALTGCVLNELCDGSAPVPWRRYPADEVYDPLTHAQYFYHAHSPGQQSTGEHGHFHLFLRAEGMTPGATPLLLPELAVAGAVAQVPQAAPAKRGNRDEVAHLVAIALDRSGRPCRLFTTNRWVTGETWYRAADVTAMLDRFAIGAGLGPDVVNRWVVALVQLFRPQIAELLEARDEAVMAWRRRWRTQVLEDPRLEIPSTRDIDFAAQLRLAAAGRAPSRPRPPRLPPMAEGWVDP